MVDTAGAMTTAPPTIGAMPGAVALISLRRSDQDPITVSETIEHLDEVVRSLLREDDGLRRLPSGDIVISTELTEHQAERFARRLAEALRRLAPSWARDRIGVAIVLSGPGSDHDTMIREAHRALADPTTTGAPVLVDAPDRRDGDIAHLITGRLQRPGFDATAEPIDDLVTGHRLGLQVLPLLRSPNGAELPAWRFAQVAQREGLAVDIDHRTRRAALSALADIPTHQVMAFNVSSDSLRSPVAVARICRDLATTGRAADRFAIEIPETAAGHPMVMRSVRRLAQAGHQIWLDDFGRRVGSIAALTSMPITGLKLHHRALEHIANRRDEPFGRQVAKLIATADHVVATGLHSARRIDLAADLAIHLGQGRAVAAGRRLGAGA